MRLLRNKFLSKFLAVFLLITILESTIHATVSLALTTGPHQPEYTSYESADATDMVNLLTGDFTFNLPILEVPGPDGGFSVPLTYNAGIGVDQEASWVGLGWTLNVGAVTRSIVQFPDDASGEVQSVTQKNLDGVRGWTSNALGFGQIGWNTEAGHYGSISLLGLLSVTWDDKGISSVGSAGFNFSSSGVSFDAAQFVEAAFTIATMGTGTLGKFLTQSAISIGTTAAMSFVGSNQTPNAPTDGYWQFSKRTSSGFLGLWEDYWIWLDQTRYEEMFGILNLDKLKLTLAPTTSAKLFPNGVSLNSMGLTINGVNSTIYQFVKNGNSQGNASDISYFIPDNKSYLDATGPALLASDNYSVKGPGISGSIKPYRLEIGSVSMPRDMTQNHARLATVTHLPYKVPFIYEGSNANRHFNHVGSSTAVSSPTFYYGINSTPGSTNVSANSSLSIDMNDVIFQNQFRADLAATKKIPMANHVEWVSNDEIANNNLSGMMDYFSGSDRSQFRQQFNFGPRKSYYTTSNDFTNGRIYLTQQDVNALYNQTVDLSVVAYDPSYDWNGNTGTTNSYSLLSKSVIGYNNSTAPFYITVDVSNLLGSIAGKYCELTVTTGFPKRGNSIGGYAVTGVNGMTYHFALPNYEYSNYTKVQKATNPTTQYSEIKRDEPFANTWLLTGITGPDFVDRGGVGNAPNGVIDINDWGHWIKFNYGKYSDDYQWRIPFSDNSTTPDATGTSLTSSTGHRQTYYLNSIETRTHVAIFIKDNRSDNKGKNISAIKPTDGRSLLLKEIALLTRQDYQKLFMASAQGGFGMATDVGLVNLGKCWMMSDYFSSSGNHLPQGNFMIQNALKRISFSYSYDLCPGSLNSEAPNGAKLTLKAVSIIGRNNAKTVPDYKFEYGNNPSYNANSWDGWGIYSSSASSVFNSHQASSNNADGAAWSLTRVTNPMGSTIDVAYERDDYYSISGNSFPNTGTFSSSTICGSCSSNYGNNTFNNIFNPNNQLVNGDQVMVSGTANYNCATTGATASHSFSNVLATVSNVSTSTVTFSSLIGGSSTTCPSNGGVSYSISFQKLADNKKGGNLRVASMTLNDNDKQFKTRYIYRRDDGYSSGVVAREPEYIKTQDYPFYDLPGYPFTPVMYSKVTVLSGKLSNDSDYHTRQVYEFETPDQNMVMNNVTNPTQFTRITDKTFSGLFYYQAYTKTVKNEIADYTSKIGKLKSVSTYEKNNSAPVSTSYMYYSSSIPNRNSSTNALENNYQGVYSEGTLMFDRIFSVGGATQPNTHYDWNKIARTTVLKYPYELTRVINSKDGFVTESENQVWDLTTGLVVEKKEKSALGSVSKKVTKLAHTVYSEMGSKAVNINNKNMLGHEAANYTYLLDASGNSIGLLSASVQTWKSDWANYRYLNGSTYAEGADGSPNVWRKHQSWVYKGNYSNLRPDGSLNFSTANEFDFSTAPPPDPDYFNKGWQKTSEVTRYNHYSAALEGKDLNNIFSASKNDIGQQQVYASATNANYFEFAYSGAEDWAASGTGLYLGGEVAKGSGTAIYKTPNGNETHTGQVAMQLSVGVKGFVYKPASLTPNRTYRVSAWTNSPNGAIYYNLNNVGEQTVLPVSTMKVGDWYQINAQIPVTTFSTLEVGVKSTNGTVSFDDFRFQPLDAAVTANVFDPVTGNVTFSLDNQNMFTKYEYNDRGQLIKTYSESFKYGVKLVSESKMNYRRFSTNQ
jgi:hypothetical protein